MNFIISFKYIEQLSKWEVYATGATSELEALQGFNAVILTCDEATPNVDYNKAELQPDGSYRISVGKLTPEE